MRCRKARWYLSARCDGTLSERQRARLDDHLQGCTGCRQEAFYFSEIAALSGRLEQKTVRPDFNIRLRAAIRRADADLAIPQAWYQKILAPRWRVALSAAVAVFALGVGYGSYQAFTTDEPGTQADLPGDRAVWVDKGAEIPANEDMGLPNGWTPLVGSSEDAQRIREHYLNASQYASEYILETVTLDDPMTQKPEPKYLMPVMSSEQVVKQVSY